MPVHDWTLVPAGMFHDFHSSWIIHLKETLNGGLLPEDYYALAEQQAGRVLTDILTLHSGDPGSIERRSNGPLAVLEAPPRVSRKVVAGPNATFRNIRRTLAIRHVSGHRLVALIEIVSPANKDRAASVRDLVEKVCAALRHGCHVLCIDLFPPGPADPRGMHNAIWEEFDAADDVLVADKPLTLAAYVAAAVAEAYVEPIAVGDTLPDMPLFLESFGYVNVPLEATYQSAYRGTPAYWRAVLEGRAPPGLPAT
jgi:hypothetical protein